MQLQVKAAARFPLEGVDWPRKLLLGGATGLFLELVFVGLEYLVYEEAHFYIAWLVVGLNFPALGYILRVYRTTLRQEAAGLPEWENWAGLLRSGLAVFALGLAYGILPLLLILLGLNLLVKAGILLVLGMILVVLAVLAGVFAMFFLPMALARYLEQRRLEVVFHPPILWDGITPVLAEYAAAYLLSIGSYLLAILVAVIPYLGGLLWPFLWFYLMLVQAHLFGEVCAKVA